MIAIKLVKFMVPVCDICRSEGPGAFLRDISETDVSAQACALRDVAREFYGGDAPDNMGHYWCSICRTKKQRQQRIEPES